MRIKRIVFAAIGIVLVGGTVAACGSYNEQFKDAPVGQRQNVTADVIEMPDKFSNLATVCNNGNRVYVAFHGDGAYAAVAVVAQDPTCKK
jgi:hypothetical protein